MFEFFLITNRCSSSDETDDVKVLKGDITHTLSLEIEPSLCDYKYVNSKTAASACKSKPTMKYIVLKEPSDIVMIKSRVFCDAPPDADPDLKIMISKTIKIRSICEPLILNPDSSDHVEPATKKQANMSQMPEDAIDLIDLVCGGAKNIEDKDEIVLSFNRKDTLSSLKVKVNENITGVFNGQEMSRLPVSTNVNPNDNNTKSKSKRKHYATNIDDGNNINPSSKKIRNRPDRKISKNNKSKSQLSRYIIAKKKLHIMSQYILNYLSSKIKDDITFHLKNISTNQHKLLEFVPTPIVTLSFKMISKYINFDNTIILQHPRFDCPKSNDLIYDKQPIHIGSNISSHNLGKPNIVVKLSELKNKRLTLLIEKQQFFNIIKKKGSKNVIEIKIPDTTVLSNKDINLIPKNLQKDYVLLLLASNNNHGLKTNSDRKWDNQFTLKIQKRLKKNMSTSKKNPSKHFKSCGDYYGFGLIGKYELKNHMSVFQFAGNESPDDEVQNLLKIFAKDIDYGFNRMLDVLPNSIYCGFCIMSSIAKIILENKEKCPEIYKELTESNGISESYISTSNWLCHNAETLEFHQEYDSSYTFISVPIFNYDKLNKEKKNQQLSKPYLRNRDTIFEFKWTKKLSTIEADDTVLQIKMEDGVGLFYSGFGCYHRQNLNRCTDFWNYSSYQNKSFLQKFRSSLIRSFKNN